MNLAVIFVCALGLSTSAIAKPISVDELKKAQADIKVLDSLDVQFVQSQYTSLRKKTRSSKGRALFAKPGKFRWSVDSEDPEELIYNGDTLFQYKPKEKSASKFGTMAKTSQDIQELANLVMNVEKLLNTYDVVTADSEKQVIDMELKPKAESEVEKVNLRVSTRKQRNYVKTVKISYKNGNVWTIDFKNPRTEPIDPSKFNFAPPPDVRVNTIK